MAASPDPKPQSDVSVTHESRYLLTRASVGPATRKLAHNSVMALSKSVVKPCDDDVYGNIVGFPRQRMGPLHSSARATMISQPLVGLLSA